MTTETMALILAIALLLYLGIRMGGRVLKYNGYKCYIVRSDSDFEEVSQLGISVITYLHIDAVKKRLVNTLTHLSLTNADLIDVFGYEYSRKIKQMLASGFLGSFLVYNSSTKNIIYIKYEKGEVL